MQKIKRFFECLIPVMACNMKCSYCYVIQRDNRKNRMTELKYSPYQIGLALTMKRFGGGAISVSVVQEKRPCSPKLMISFIEF